MKNRKTFLSIIMLVVGLLCLAYYFTMVPTRTIYRAFFITPAVLNYSSFIFMLSAVSMIISGCTGLLSRNRIVRLILYFVSLAITVISAVISPTDYIAYMTLAVSLINLLVQLLDKSPDKRVYLVMRKGDMLLTLAQSRPSYFEVLAEKSDLSASELEHRKLADEKQKAVSHRAKKIKNATGYAISPNAKNYRKKAKRKNRKR